MSDSELLLSRVEDCFEIAGRGCVIVPGIEPSLLGDRIIRRGAALNLRRPNGSTLSTRIHEIEFIDGPNRRSCVPITLPPGVSKTDVPVGTEVWLCSSIDPRAV